MKLFIHAVGLFNIFFSHVGTEPLLPGYYGELKVSCSRTLHDSECGSNHGPLAPEPDALPLSLVS